MARAAGLQVTGLWSVRPGQYERRAPDLDYQEFLVTATV